MGVYADTDALITKIDETVRYYESIGVLASVRLTSLDRPLSGERPLISNTWQTETRVACSPSKGCCTAILSPGDGSCSTHRTPSTPTISRACG